MALWTMNPTQDHDVYTVVYLLKDALKSALNDAWYFERTTVPKAEIKGAGHAEIAARLGRFRDGCMGLKEREALMLTKLLRARNWATELRRLVPEVQPDIDQFLVATVPCEGMQDEYGKDAQRMFHGGGSLIRFLAQRKPAALEAASEDEHNSGSSYLMGGRKALFELRAACEVFLAQIDEEFFSSGSSSLSVPAASLLALLDAPEADIPASLAVAVH